MKRVKMARAVSLLLASVLLASSITGCGGKESASSSSQTKITKKMSASETIKTAIDNTVNADSYKMNFFSNIALTSEGEIQITPVSKSKLDAIDFPNNPIVELQELGFYDFEQIMITNPLAGTSIFSGATPTRTIVKYQENKEPVFLYEDMDNPKIIEAVASGKLDGVKGFEELDGVELNDLMYAAVIAKGDKFVYNGILDTAIENWIREDYISRGNASDTYSDLDNIVEYLESDGYGMDNVVDLFNRLIIEMLDDNDELLDKYNSKFSSIQALHDGNIQDYIDQDTQYNQIFLGIPYRHYLGAITKLFDEYEKKNEKFDFVLDMKSGEDGRYYFEVYLVDYLNWYQGEANFELPTELMKNTFSSTDRNGVKLCVEFLTDGNYLKEITIGYHIQGQYQIYLKEIFEDVNAKTEYSSIVDELLSADSMLLRKINELSDYYSQLAIVDVDNDGIYELYLKRFNGLMPYVYNGHRYALTAEEKYRNYDGDDLVFYDCSDLLAYLEDGVSLPPKELQEALEAYQEYVDGEEKVQGISLMYLDDGEIPYLVYLANYEVLVAYYKNGRVSGEYLGVGHGVSSHAFQLWYCYDTQSIYAGYAYKYGEYYITSFKDGVGTVELSGSTDYETERYVDSNPITLSDFHSRLYNGLYDGMVCMMV